MLGLTVRLCLVPVEVQAAEAPAVQARDDEGTVTITVHPNQALLTIPPLFYGINIHPGSAQHELAKPALLTTLKPDTVRIMTRMRSDWLPTGREVQHLSPAPGVFEWDRLDALVKQIVAAGAEPYLALGFGPPHWLTRNGDPLGLEAPRKDAVEQYAVWMAEIANRYAGGNNPVVHSLSVENEPENVRYAIDDYIELFRVAKTHIKKRAPNVLIGGPTIGYTQWQQPDGSKLNFSASMNRMKAANTPFDFIDWHVYTTNPESVLNTVKSVKRTFGENVPLVISELNRDWRYSGEKVSESKQNNTGWESLAWLAYLYDELQQAGVDRVYYFAWRENNLGLIDGRLNTLRPNYYLLWALTNHIGRHRIATTSSEPSVGCIATRENGKLAMLVYNRTQREVLLQFKGIPAGALSTTELSEDWLRNNKNISPKANLPSFATISGVSGSTIKLSAGGFLILKEP